jgi:hypothetical protein
VLEADTSVVQYVEHGVACLVEEVASMASRPNARSMIALVPEGHAEEVVVTPATAAPAKKSG